MQKHTVLINYAFSSNTEPTITTFSGPGQSFLVNQDDYYLNNLSGLNLGVTNPTNVRDYLNDAANQRVINDFFSYLTGNINQDQFREIFYSDQKLSNVFNLYYEQSVLVGQQASTYYIDQQLTATTQTSYYYSNFNWDGVANVNYLTGVTQEINEATRFTEERIVLESFTTDESYFIPVFIKSNSTHINQITYEFNTIFNTIYSIDDGNIDLDSDVNSYY